MPRFLINFSYDGTNYNGYQKQKGMKTIQEKMETALTSINNNSFVKLTASGRTDAKVHAINQYAHADIDVNITEYYKKVQGEKTNVERNLALGINVLFEKDKKTFDWEKNKVEWSAIPVSYLKVMDKFNYNSLNDYFDRLKNERKYYVSNSVLDSGDKLMTVYSFDNFNGVNRDNIQNKLKEKYGDNLKDLKFDDEKKTLFIQLPNTSTRNSTEPIFRYIFNE